jgi:RNA polymerase sigma-70 factor (ECF subfamily)
MATPSEQVEPVEMMWNQYRTRLLSFIRSRVSDDSDAEDILQEVFIRVHYHLCCSQEWNKPEAWIYQISRNLIIDYYRRRRSTVEISEDLPDEEDLLDDDPQTQLALSLKDTIALIPEPYRQALILAEYQGFSQKEIANRLGISYSGAKSRVQRAREKLRDLLLTCCHFELDRRGRIINYYERCCGCNPVH